jgi:hypothetical protein
MVVEKGEKPETSRRADRQRNKTGNRVGEEIGMRISCLQSLSL